MGGTTARWWCRSCELSMGPWQHGCEGNIPGSETESERRCTGWGASRDGIPSSLSCGNSAYDLRLDRRSRMRRESHVRFCEGAGGQFPRATRLVICFSRQDDARRVWEVLPKRVERFGLRLHPDKTRLVPFGSPNRSARAEPPPGTFDFLGFTHY